MRISPAGQLIGIVITWACLISLFLNCHVCSAEDCVKIDNCSCKTSRHKINLADLSGQFSKTTPYFKDVPGNDKAYYSYQPCVEFSEGPSGCTNVAACQKTESAMYYSLGTQDSSVFGGDPANNTLYVNYTSPDGRVAHVKLRCVSEKITPGALLVTGESPAGSKNYVMEFSTSLVCVNKGLSNGSILVIVFFVLALIYFIGGILFCYFLRGARGVEMIPNYEFWSEFPLLVKDGVVFTINGCKTTDNTYEQI